jgi:uncharacterized protein (DUF58 family)
MRTHETLRRLRRLEITTRRMVQDTLAGQYHSVFKGRGMAFSEVRPYQPGDEVRFIDWNVTARTGAPFVKVFTEERELTVMLLVDRSASLEIGAGPRAKSEVAAEIAALIAFSAASNNDRVGLALFDQQIRRFVPARKGRGHVLRVLAEILDDQPGGAGTDLGSALTTLHQAVKRRCVAFVVSDFLDAGWERPLAIASQRHDVVPVVLWEPLQQELPDVGLLEAEDAETGEQLLVDTSDPAFRQAYADHFAQAEARRERAFQRLQLDTVRIGATESYDKALMRFFERRARRAA